MTTTIRSNGSKWMGQAPDSIDTLLNVLAKTPLDHTFERYGNFIEAPTVQHPCTKIWGNFAKVSHVFHIDTDDPTLIQQLTQAIRANQARDDYGPNGNI